MSELFPKLAFALFVVAVILIFWRSAVHARRLERARQDALDAFRSTCIESIDKKYSFSGSSATIVKIEESANPHREPISWFTLTVFARNEFGEYFMFKSTKPSGFIKHIGHAVAKQVLKHEYKPPPTAA